MNNFGSRLPFSPRNSRNSSPPPRGTFARGYFSIQEIQETQEIQEDDSEYLCVFDPSYSNIFPNLNIPQDPQTLPSGKQSLIRRFLNNGRRDSLTLVPDQSYEWPNPYRARKSNMKPKRKEASSCWILCFGLLILVVMMILHLLSSTKKSNILYYD